MTIGIRFAARSDVGMLREGNEDSAYAGSHLLAVADGMGGHVGGEIASAAAIGELRKLDADLPAGELLAALEHTVKAANEKLHRIVESDPALQGMGTTLTAMLWAGSQVALVHIGDSRAYLLRDGSLFQITHDHTLVQSLVDEGRISPDEAASHPQRSLLLRALDGRGEVDPDLSLREAKVGDRYLLCSDGLSGVVTAETIFEVLSEYTDPEQAVRQLIDLANRGGGPDNITCVIADVVELAPGQPMPGAQPLAVGAAANVPRSDMPDAPGGGPPPGTPVERSSDSPAGRAAQLRDTMPQPPVVVDEMPPPQAAPMREPHPVGPPPEPMPMMPARAPRRRWTWLVVALGVFVVLLAGASFAAVRSIRNDGYFARDEGGKVVVYKGSPESVLGVALHTKAPQQPSPAIDVSKLPAATQNSLAEEPFMNLTSADGWKQVAGQQLCLYLVHDNGKGAVVIERGKKTDGPSDCKKEQFQQSSLKVADLPRQDREAVQRNEFAFGTQAQAKTQLDALDQHSKACSDRDTRALDGFDISLDDCPGGPSNNRGGERP